MSEKQDQKPAAEEQTTPEAAAQGERPTGDTGAAPDGGGLTKLVGKTAEEELAEARDELLAAQKQMQEAQKRLQDAMEVVSGRKFDEWVAAEERPHHSTLSLLKQPEPEVRAQGETEESSSSRDGVEAAEPKEPETGPDTYSALNNLFAGLAPVGPLALLALMACMAWPIFLEPSMATYCPAEVQSLSAYIHSLASHSWFAPVAPGDGGAVPQWPLFTWCFALLAFIPQLASSDYILPIVSFGSAFVAAFGVWALGMAAGFGALRATAAGVILLCCPLFAPLPHFMGPAALAAGLMLLALACFCRGWMASRSWLALPLGFVFTALAGLCGGLLHFAVPLIASFLFLLWRGSFKRAQRIDAIFGFILMLAICGAWIGAIMVEHDKSTYLNELFAGAVQFAWPLPLLWFKPVFAGILGLLPWLLLIFGVSWFKVLGRSAKTLSASRHTNGSAMVWISIVLAIVIAVFVPAFHPAAVAICCLGAVLLGKAFVNLGPAGNRFFFLLAGLFLILIGAVVLAFTFPEGRQLLNQHVPFLASLPAFADKILALSEVKIIAGILILAGLLAFYFVRRFLACGGLVYAALVIIVLSLAGRMLLLPHIQAVAGTPLVTYATVEEHVLAAMKAPEQAKETPKPAPEQPAQVTPTTQPEASAASAEPAQAEPQDKTSTEPEQTAPAEASPAEPAEAAPAAPADDAQNAPSSGEKAAAPEARP